ncbi:hypothetical protein ACWT_4784 [Actinoplanes sp. SE50]|nr:hypothetical protein ACPL_4914 [Actinoplanes sp. SE50/110]ATO84199.1 hypothetical protein ACWT_4784 [Actinoplanes sp. SE50]SLM01609.1 hypothetical protein ACSP50_4845 [Actinoplanes sp. SE50/110]
MEFCLWIKAVGYSAEPVEYFDEVQGGLEVRFPLVASGGVSAPVEAAFDLVAPLDGVRIERGSTRRSSVASTGASPSLSPSR